ncbi:MAG: hypothetical protein RR150_12710, partial [Clostridia bacterium]
VCYNHPEIGAQMLTAWVLPQLLHATRFGRLSCAAVPSEKHDSGGMYIYASRTNDRAGHA